MFHKKVIIAAVYACFVAGGGRAQAQQFSAHLVGFSQTGGLNNDSGAILTTGSGTLT
jgi:hypothetical protein